MCANHAVGVHAASAVHAHPVQVISSQRAWSARLAIANDTVDVPVAGLVAELAVGGASGRVAARLYGNAVVMRVVIAHAFRDSVFQ